MTLNRQVCDCNSARKLTNSWINSRVYPVYRNLMPNKNRRSILWSLSGICYSCPGRVLGGQFCIRSMLMKDSAEQLCRRPVGQRGYSHKAPSLIREWRPLNRERHRSALSLWGTGHGTALTQTILGQTLPVIILQNAVIDNAKKAVISHRK